MRTHQGKTIGEVPVWYESLGDTARPTVLLIMGQGGQATSWSDEFCEPIARAGYRVVTFDNRDAGLSGSAPGRYTMGDMARDAVTVLNALNVSAANVVGQSMGGMIAQEMAIAHPDRVVSLSLLSTSADVALTPPTQDVSEVASDLAVNDKGEWIEAAVRSLRLQTGSRWPFDEQLVRSRIEAEVERSFRPDGALRQVRAILTSPSRTERLASVNAPTIVVHGDEDPVLPPEHAVALTNAIATAELHLIAGVGHALPWGHWDVILPLLLDHLDNSSS